MSNVKTDVFLNKVYLENGAVRLDLYLNPIPKNFFGIGMDFVFEDKSAIQSYDSFYPGSYFDFLDESSKPFALISTGDDRLIFGLSFKTDTVPLIENANIGSFVFKKSFDGRVNFEHTVLSSLDKKKGRLDLENVTWHGLLYEQDILPASQLFLQEKNNSSTQAIQKDNIAQNSSNKPFEDDSFNGMEFSEELLFEDDQSLEGKYNFESDLLSIILVLIALSIIAFLIFKRKK